MSEEKMEKMDGKTKDIVEQNIEQLKELFPSVFSEGKIQFNKLEELLGNYVVEDEDHYNFTWHGKRNASRLAQTPSTGTLRPCKDESVDWDNTENLFIEGDNLEVLKLLQKSYHRQVKMIYIDPPYNTGKEFIYPDKFQDNLDTYLKYTGQVDAEGYKFSANTDTTGRYHTNWLNMMYPRLKLARNLMRDDGVIFISIDDNEQSNLKKLCDEVFGEENFINEFIWKNGRTSSAIYTKEQEYILAYGKNIETLEFIKYNGGNEIISDRAIKKIGVKNPASDIFFPKGIRFQGEDKTFPNNFGGKENVEVVTGEFRRKNNLLAEDVVLKAGWVMKDMIEDWIDNKDVIDSKGQKVSEFYFKDNGVLQYIKEKGTIHPRTIIENFSTKSGTNEVTKLMGAKVFDYPKPVNLLKFISIMTDDNDIILDFFAGSSTTAHAVMQLNAEDGGNRRCISVQLPEPCDEKSEAFKAGYKNIAEISKERIRRAGKKIKEENRDYEGDLGFKVFKLASSNIKRWEAGFNTLESDLMDAVDYLVKDRTDEDILYELCIKLGLDLSIKIQEKSIADKKLFILGRGYLVVCLDNAITMDLVNGIGALKAELAPEDGMRVVFKDSGFNDDVVKANALQTLKRFGIDDVKSL